MNINLTPDQYRTLVKLIYMGHWMLTAHKDTPDDVIDAAASHIYSFAKSAGVESLFEADADNGKFYSTRAFEDLMSESIRDYDDQAFWDELIDRLTSRDFLAKYGEKAINKMTVEERFAKMGEFEERYDEEFADHGLERIAIDDSKP